MLVLLVCFRGKYCQCTRFSHTRQKSPLVGVSYIEWTLHEVHTQVLHFIAKIRILYIIIIFLWSPKIMTDILFIFARTQVLQSLNPEFMIDILWFFLFFIKGFYFLPTSQSLHRHLSVTTCIVIISKMFARNGYATRILLQKISRQVRRTTPLGHTM